MIGYQHKSPFMWQSASSKAQITHAVYTYLPQHTHTVIGYQHKSPFMWQSARSNVFIPSSGKPIQSRKLQLQLIKSPYLEFPQQLGTYDTEVVQFIYVSVKWVIFGSGYYLLPVWRQALNRTMAYCQLK